ncbi:hypothetical protein B7P43_G05931 [Cryptotermes secundus]|uniref:DNA-directed primase/polymerase protein n=1 Tax=Cryptotermes secundus TaxID=105785 RepID=A0A2J7QA80_9NEOP|nr:hypothetical protein B7P43_G05931 [Cryptotermes secundus]
MSEGDNYASVTLTPQTFYGKVESGKSCESQTNEKLMCRNSGKDSQLQKWPRQLDPTATWKIMRKQQDALEYVRVRKNGMMAFAFQDKFGCRMFLVAHPTVFWFYDSRRSCQDRCSYEIILEHAVCKLYFDLEFYREHNPHHDGHRMVESFIKIISFHLKKEWGITADRRHVLDLDSSTENKFSRHLIFMLPNAIFQDSYNVGNFVKDMCSELRLFCDESVYTKNRHFRLYMSTKLNKNAPLIVSQENQYKPTTTCEKDESNDTQLFLDSLITYIPVHVNNLRILKYGYCSNQEFYSGYRSPKVSFEGLLSSCNVKSPYPEVDKFIMETIYPGRIWRWSYFSSGNHIVYDIIGYRYCGNIGRQHHSNNIKYVVNLSNYTYYQKCHDPDCANYRSAECKLPAELTFFLEDDSFLHAAEDNSRFSTTLGYFGIQEEDFVQLVDAVECTENDSYNLLPPEDVSSVPSSFPNYGISDNDLLSAMDVVEN